MKTKSIKSLIDKAEKIKTEIAARRDKLRDVIDDLYALHESFDEGVDSLDEGIRCLREGIDSISEQV
jgi:predicted  nucleic acid-binding Zn-ribbon protein